ASVNLRASLAPGDIIATGANGRAMLTKGDDYVVVAPASRLALPKEQQASGFTRLIQQVGTMLYKVKRTGTPHFTVETPMLAAVVKGTTFSVVVDHKGAAVQVTEGIVEVSSLTGNTRRLVERGMAVYVGRERPNEVIEVQSDAVGLPQTGTDDSAVKIEGSSDVSLATVSELTDGLIREAPTARPVATAPAGRVVTTTLGGSATTGTLAPVADVETTLPAVTESVAQTVQATVPAMTAPVVDVVQATVPAITAPVVEIVQATVPAITQPVVAIVQAVPAITAPIVEIVQAVPAITAPVVAIVAPVIPVVTQPVTTIVQTAPTILCTLLCGR
ncbi:MAG TPA: FecR domain-containing protein, partial [Sphingomicrobium sp.]|nr:FecR domain-containing protein [Sphingomicrobium sp.]